jgi:hypothetical protein
MDYVSILNTIADAHEQDSENEWVESAALREVAAYISKLEKSLELYERERIRFRHAKPEMTGVYFISGDGGNKDNNCLPEHIWVCPAYGCDWSQRYVRTEQTSGPGW